MKKIIITGAGGQLGTALQKFAADLPDFQYTFSDRKILDITDADAVQQAFAAGNYWACINCAAYTAVDKAESEPALAFEINEKAAEVLAKAAAKQKMHFIHISSDYVYHNTSNRPLLETDETSPKGIYAQSKLAGDKAVLTANPDALVIRTSWVFSEFGHNFVKTMLRLGREKNELNVVNDQIGCPTYACHLAKALLFICQKINENPTQNYGGIYHYSNTSATNWADFAKEIMLQAHIYTCQINPIPTKNYPTPAERPPYSVLDTTKIQNTFGLEIPAWQDALRECLKNRL